MSGVRQHDLMLSGLEICLCRSHFEEREAIPCILTGFPDLGTNCFFKGPDNILTFIYRVCISPCSVQDLWTSWPKFSKRLGFDPFSLQNSLPWHLSLKSPRFCVSCFHFSLTSIWSFFFFFFKPSAYSVSYNTIS